MNSFKTYFFISDLHLGLESRDVETEKEKKLILFLNYAKSNCDELFIMGDLFDYWFEYKRVIQKGFYKTFTALKEFTETGRKLHYFIGNHDFLHRDFFEKEIGAKLYYQPAHFELNGKKFFIGHGDGLIKNDIGYKILKAILRNKILQKMYSFIHPDLGIKLASLSSKTSRNYNSKKYNKDCLFEVAKEKIKDGYDYVIFGHSHVLSKEKFENGYYINLGSWLQKPCYGKFINTFEIIDWVQNDKKSNTI
ncbi:UDP-2,3-diacylglucosamine diphosphatase [Rosettibacter firmus]|uniref:UDP-2,3-diacylglucosamine diphosphatase n=1 Tax=Rosettibacter firmus TaxID=3111522 RepID=UPI00336C0D5C